MITHPSRTSLKGMCNTNSSVDIFCKYRRSQPINGIIREFDDLCRRSALNDYTRLMKGSQGLPSSSLNLIITATGPKISS